MGMTILQAKQRLHEKWMQLTKDGTDEEMMQALSIADTVIGNYDENLKADLVAMLEVIKLRIDNLPEPLNRDRVNYCIQQKINELKAESEATHDV